jgi:hypothetical protein
MAISSSFLIALEVLADFDVGVFLYAAFIFIDELEIRRQHPSVGGWPTFTFCVKVGTHAACVGIFISSSPALSDFRP